MAQSIFKDLYQTPSLQSSPAHFLTLQQCRVSLSIQTDIATNCIIQCISLFINIGWHYWLSRQCAPSPSHVGMASLQ